MEYYVEITLLPTSEISIYFLWEKVYQQIHLALVELKDVDGFVPIGVSFPAYNIAKRSLGNKLRLFAESYEILFNLKITQWLFRLMDYVHITKIRNIPEPDGFVIFNRVRTKSSRDRLARRKARRQGVSVESAKGMLVSFHEKVSLLPYIYVKSLSSSRRFPLIIGCSKMERCQSDGGGKFSTYGLSNCCAVPLF